MVLELDVRPRLLIGNVEVGRIVAGDQVVKATYWEP